jgi:myosin heavy subunit
LPEIDQFQLAQDRVREERLRIGLEEEIRAHRGLCLEFSKLENENAELDEQTQLLKARLEEAQNLVGQLQELISGNETEISNLNSKLGDLQGVEGKNESLRQSNDNLGRKNRVLTMLAIVFLRWCRMVWLLGIIYIIRIIGHKY